MRTILATDIQSSIADALQFISYQHPVDFIIALKQAYDKEPDGAAKQALGQILANSRLSARERRPVCQDTGLAHVYVRLGMDVRIVDPQNRHTPCLQTLANQATRIAYQHPRNPLRASVVQDPLGLRHNTRDNTPAIVQVELVEGDDVELTVAAKGGGGDVKARYGMLTPGASVEEWVLKQLPEMGAGWCPPGVIGVAVGGTPEQVLAAAKKALFAPIDMAQLRQMGPQNAEQQLRLSLYEKINALGIGAQGLGGLTTVLDVKLKQLPCHAALLPIALVPNCAATRFVTFTLDGSGPATFTPPDQSVWENVPVTFDVKPTHKVNLDQLTLEELAQWRAGDQLLLSGRLYTARDAAHRRLTQSLEKGEPLPVCLQGKGLYYVGPVQAVNDEVVGPAGPTTASRMDQYMPALLEHTGLLFTIGKGERSPATAQVIKQYGGAYLSAVGGAALLISKAIKQAKVVAYEDLGMEAIYEFEVLDMPVMVAIDAKGRRAHKHFSLTHVGP